MKKITFMWAVLFCTIGTVIAQTPTELQEIQMANATAAPTINIQDLLDRLAAAGDSAEYDNLMFTQEERIALQQYFKQQQSSATRMADIIPNAGATESFGVVVGDFFYDPVDGTGQGGPGGDCSGPNTGGPIPGNYPNCGCTTVTTLTGTDLAVEFLSFNIFGTFDVLNIYDGPDTSSPQIYDSNLNAETDNLAGMIAANGSAVFESTSGALTFEFSATAVVDSCGWEVEVVPPGGGGGGGGGMTERVFAFDAGFCSDEMGTFDVAGPYLINTVGTSTLAIFSGDYDGSGTLYAMDNDALTLLTVDTATGATTTVGPLTNIVPGDATRGMAWDESTGTMYLMSGAGTDYTIYTVDLSNGTLTSVGTNAAGGGLPIWLAIDDSGNAYMADLTDDSLYSIDLSDGSNALIGALGIDINFAQDADFDPDTNTLYMGAYIGGGANQWASVDVTTGAATGLGMVDTNSNPGCGAELGIVAIEGTVVINPDDCTTAQPVACDDVIVGDTSDNTDTGGANASPDEWYSFTGTGSSQIVTVSLCDGGTSYDSLLTVFDSCGGAVVAGNDDACGLQSELSFLSDGTSTYYIAVEGFGTNAGAFSMAITCVDPLPNDMCDGAEPIACGETITGSTTIATPDAMSPDCGGGNDSPGVWYVIDDTSGLVTDYTVSLCDGGTTYDSKLVVYSGDCGTLVCVAENDDSCGLQSEVSFQGDGSSTYYILVNGFGSGSSGDFSLNLECAPVPPPNDMIVNSIDVDEIGFPYTDPAVAMPAATTEAGGTPANCDNAGVLGVWYNFVPTMGGTATASVTSPAGFTSVTFYTAPDENAVETDLTLVDWFDNQCVPGVDASIPVTAGQAYYVYVANHEGITDIVIDGDFFLGVGDAVVDGFTYYPNPANDEITLDAGTRSIETATIYNILGQTVVEQTVGAPSTQLNVANLTVGTYILKVLVDGETGIYKIVKQ